MICSKRSLRDEWLNPSEDFVRLFAKRVYTGLMTQAVREQFTEITKKAFHEFVSERINERLKSALEHESRNAEVGIVSSSPVELEASDESGVITTDAEIDGYYVVKSIVCEIVEPSRVFMRDTKSYCGILLDDNNRKPICRLHFNYSQKYIGLFDADKNESREAIGSINDIYKFANRIKQAVLRYDSPNAGASAEENGRQSNETAPQP